MAFFSRSFEDLVSSSLQKLSAQTNITQLSPGSKARFILDTVNREQAAQFQIFDINLVQAFIKYADGRFLDMFGDLLQIPRINATHATDTGNNFMFYVETGTFGDINDGIGFLIPAGRTVSTVPLEASVITPGIQEQPVVTYKTVESVSALADQSTVFVGVRAQVEGLNSSITKNVLNKHDVTNYSAAAKNKLKCTNTQAIQNGTDRESDASYRFRLLNAFRAKSMANRFAIRLAALSVAGVSDVVDVIAEQGPGSVSIYVKGLTPTTGTALLQSVATSIEEVSSLGVRAFVLAPTPMGVQLSLTINWTSSSTQAEIARGYAAIRQAVEDYINSLDIGEELDLEVLVGVVLAAAPNALSVGRDKPNEFNQVFVHRQDPTASSSTIKSLVYGNKIIPLYNERLILETSGSARGIKFN